MTTYPRTVKTFIPWSRAMVAGATVDKPSYPGTKKPPGASKRRKKRRRRKKKVKDA